jgi:hypothetical protein
MAKGLRGRTICRRFKSRHFTGTNPTAPQAEPGPERLTYDGAGRSFCTTRVPKVVRKKRRDRGPFDPPPPE